MTLLAFTLSMPNVGSWDGKWTGAGNLYVRVYNVPTLRAAEILKDGYFHYSFGDGWGASIDVEQVDSKTAAKLRKKTKGFCGYDWMIQEIIRWGKIYGRHTNPDELAKAGAA